MIGSNTKIPGIALPEAFLFRINLWKRGKTRWIPRFRECIPKVPNSTADELWAGNLPP